MALRALSVGEIAYATASDTGLSWVWIFVLLLLVVLLLGLLTQPPAAKEPDPLDKAIDKIFSQLEADARVWKRDEAVAPLNEARTKITKLLKERKLI